jgi:hypothetical protein
LINQPITVCLDLLFWNPTSRGHAAKIILPMRLDVSLGSHSQDTYKRGNFSRMSSSHSGSTYRLRQPGKFFKRQSFYISQQNPIPQQKRMAKFTFTALPATAKLVRSFVDAELPTQVDTNIPLSCKGAVLCFYHSSPDCNGVWFSVVLGIHGRKPTPWCHISTDRLQLELSTGSEEEVSRRIRDLYDEHEE